MGLADTRLDGRRRVHESLAGWFEALSDDELSGVLDSAPTSWRLHTHGGQSGVIDVDGVKVFVKQVALTDLERLAENQGATANLFGLPSFYQYGIGSAGFGAWRELSAYRRASAWTLSGDCPHFPLLHHWRVLPRAVRPPSEEQRARMDWLADYWDRSDAVRARIEAIAAASASIVLFLEHVPEMLHTWLAPRLAAGTIDAAAETSLLRFQDQIEQTAAFMNGRGMLHFDLHAQNVLTDGDQVYVADFGLALCDDFDLSPAERAFLEAHRLYDRCYVRWALVDNLVPAKDPPALTPALHDLVDRYAPVALVMGEFFKALREEGKTSPYPAGRLEAALATRLNRR